MYLEFMYSYCNTTDILIISLYVIVMELWTNEQTERQLNF